MRQAGSYRASSGGSAVGMAGRRRYNAHFLGRLRLTPVAGNGGHMPGIGRRFVACSASVVVGLVSVACSTSKAAPTAAPAPVLWGDMKPVVSVKELMRDMLDPLADNIFDSVSIVVDKNGTVERTPRTDEDW